MLIILLIQFIKSLPCCSRYCTRKDVIYNFAFKKVEIKQRLTCIENKTFIKFKKLENKTFLKLKKNIYNQVYFIQRSN